MSTKIVSNNEDFPLTPAPEQYDEDRTESAPEPAEDETVSSFSPGDEWYDDDFNSSPGDEWYDDDDDYDPDDYDEYDDDDDYPADDDDDGYFPDDDVIDVGEDV